jgi:hypothetical protein
LNWHVFCYLGLLRMPEQLEKSLALLPEDQRAEATAFLASIKDLPRNQLAQKWSALREDEHAALRGNAYRQLGIRLDDVAPSLREWCLSRLAEQNG